MLEPSFLLLFNWNFRCYCLLTVFEVTVFSSVFFSFTETWFSCVINNRRWIDSSLIHCLWCAQEHNICMGGDSADCRRAECSSDGDTAGCHCVKQFAQGNSAHFRLLTAIPQKLAHYKWPWVFARPSVVCSWFLQWHDPPVRASLTSRDIYEIHKLTMGARTSKTWFIII